eukprot:7941627-Alexandrium_andersonii.AAC.1
MGVFSDDGTERLLGSMEPTTLDAVVPWFSDTSPEDIGLVLQGSDARPSDSVPAAAEVPVPPSAMLPAAFDPDVFEEPAPEPQVPPLPSSWVDPASVFEDPGGACISFDRGLSFTGMQHVIHNATEGLSAVLPRYHEFVFLAKQVCKFIRGRDTKPKLVQRIFSGPVTSHFQPLVHAFKGHIFLGRWGTVAFSVPELLRIEHALVYSWDKQKFLGREDARGRDDGAASDTARLVADVDKAVSSKLWWCWLKMADLLCSALRAATAWLEACPCHHAVLQQLGQHSRGQAESGLPAA